MVFSAYVACLNVLAAKRRNGVTTAGFQTYQTLNYIYRDTDIVFCRFVEALDGFAGDA